MRRREYVLGVGAGLGALSMVGERVRSQESVSVSIFETNAPVQAGEFLEVTARLENEGSETVRPAVHFEVGDERLQTRRMPVEPGESRTTTFSFRTFPVARDDEFPVRVLADGDVDERRVLVHAIDGLPAEQLRPDPEITVRSGTAVLFEIESDELGEFGGRTTWFVDGEHVGMSMGPWYSTYYADQGAEYWRRRFESTGRHRVVAAVDGETTNYRAEWIVHVVDDGAAAPTIDGVSPERGTIDVDSDEDLAVDVSDSHGRLDRVVWWLAHADVVLDATDVEGGEATASLPADSIAGCHACPVVVWVICSDGRIATASPWTFDDGTTGPTAVRIRETNAPVEGGSVLEVTAEVENTSGAHVTREVRLVVGHDPEQLDAATVSLAPGDTATVELGYETYPVTHDQTYPARVETDDDADERSVTAFGTADGVTAPTVSILETNSPVAGGEFLEVTAYVENPGDATITRDVRLVVGHDPETVDATSVTLSGGEATVVTLGYETYPVNHDQTYPVRVEAGGGADWRSVTAHGRREDAVAVSIRDTNSPVEGGEFLAVTADVENTGDETVTSKVRLVVGHDPEKVDWTTVTLEAGETATVELGYETYPVEQDQTYPARVETDDDADERSVTAHGTGG